MTAAKTGGITKTIFDIGGAGAIGQLGTGSVFDNAIELDAAGGANKILLTKDLESADAGIEFKTPVRIDAAGVTIKSGGANGDNIIFGQTLDSAAGPFALTINAGNDGNVTFTGKVGNTTAFGTFTIANAKDITVSDTFEAAATSFTSTGTLKTDGLLTATGTVNINAGGVVDVNAGITAAGQTLNIASTATSGGPGITVHGTPISTAGGNNQNGGNITINSIGSVVLDQILDTQGGAVVGADGKNAGNVTISLYGAHVQDN